MKKLKSILITGLLVVAVVGIIGGILLMQNWTARFRSEFDRFFGEGNWEYLSADIERSTVYTTYHRNRSNPMLSGRRAGYYRDWNISFTNRYGEEELWTISNHIYKINHQNYRYNWFHPNRLTAKQALAQELMEISFEMVGEEVMNEIILDVLTEEEASCMEITMSYEGGNPKPEVYDALLKEPWFKANEITATDYLATDIYDFYLYIRVHDYRLEKLTEEQKQHVSDAFEIIQDKLYEAYGENTAYEMFWGDGRKAEVQQGDRRKAENLQEEVSDETENNEEFEAIEEDIRGQEVVEDNTVDYGDTIVISCEITKQPIVWEDAGEAEFRVATTSEQFQNEFDLSEETTMKKVEEAIGKTAGESFTLWFEGDDGLYGYEYTIREVVGKPSDKVTYGDKVHTTYSMEAMGVDRGDDIKTGEQVIHVMDTDKFLARDEIGYSLSVAETRIKEIVGKGVGETFQIKQEAPEWIESYSYTIQKINKAVEYGDAIKATVRCASILAEDREDVSSQESISMELLTPKGVINLAGDDLNMADTMQFLREMKGKSIGDRVYFFTMTDDERRFYNLSILDVGSGVNGENGYEIEALMMSEEENSVYFYNDNEMAPIYYAIVTDMENHMVYEYVRGYEGDYWLETMNKMK